MQFLPRRILVTGGAVRTGRAIVKLLSERGAQVVIHAREHRSEAEDLLSLLSGRGHSVIYGDLSDDRDVERIADAASKCDGVVLNASCYRHGYQGGDAEFDALLEKVNHASQVKIIRGFLSAPHPDGGAVVAMLDQETASENDNPYLASRRALWLDMKKFAVEYGKDDIRFNALLPGPMLPPPELGDTRMVKTLPSLPLRRSVALEDAAESVAFLLACRSLTGTVLFADCGQSLANRIKSNMI